MVPLSCLACDQRVGSVGLEVAVAVRSAGSRELVLGPPAEVERAEHGYVDAEACQHYFDAAEQEGREGCSGEVAEEVDDEHLPKADDADHDTTVIFC